ncbi:nuclear transport factor 2 family protein [Nocardioides humilatus]|uniref:Nuclear transport factor 2 family protein n=1 Tax=Nocardioides humilatus TaxID=2607660 RepID=A0A5B1L9J4_9ACTN|nr:nuclear transport factor 2 family protein [Nocardioides humilatus]KAA1416429.1 nuclear transport factor 2 family protein [Nocardioides humilatus]
MTSQLTHRPATLLPANDEEVAAAYAAAYAAADLDTLREVLAPDVVSRLLMPGDFRTLHGAEAFVDELAGAVAGVDASRPHSSSVQAIGDKFVVRARIELAVGGGRYQLEHLEVVTVRGGYVVALDGVCTGFRPVAVDGSRR